MDTQTFINSGVLEAYALGACTDEEQQEVARMASEYPEVRAALLQIETDMEQVTRRLGVTPPPGSRQRVLDAVAQAKQQGTPPTNTGGTQGGRTWLGLWSWLAIALVAGGLAGYQYADLQHNADRQKMATMELSLEACETITQEKATLERQYALLSNTDTRRFDIVALDAERAQLQAFVFANPADGACLVAAADMGDAPAGQSYQLWALVDGTPVSMGVLDAAPSNRLLEVACVAGAQGYAISLEPQGGSPTPTQVIMMSQS